MEVVQFIDISDDLLGRVLGFTVRDILEHRMQNEESHTMSEERGTYHPRLVDNQISEAIKQHRVIEIVGMRGVGKFSTIKALARSAIDLRQTEAFNRAIIDPTLALLGDGPHAIAEWQRTPSVIGLIEHRIQQTSDHTAPHSDSSELWLLTRSGAIPDKAQRYAREWQHGPSDKYQQSVDPISVPMLPMTLAESGDSTCAISLTSLFEMNRNSTNTDGASLFPILHETDAPTISRLSSRGGWPAAITDSPTFDLSAGLTPAQTALNTALEIDGAQAGLNQDTALLLLLAIVKTLCTAASYDQLREIMLTAAHTGAVSKSLPATYIPTTKTIKRYDATLREMGVCLGISGWVPHNRSSKRMKVKTRRYLADPSLIMAVTQRDAGKMLDDPSLIQAAFKNLCVRDLTVYAQAVAESLGLGIHGARVMYYHDDSNLDVDIIIELKDGRWAGIELEPSAAGVPNAISTLTRLRHKLCKTSVESVDENATDTVPDNAVPEPAFLAIIVGVSHGAYRTDEGVYVIPITMLSA